jgi:hypothetical protein
LLGGAIIVVLVLSTLAIIGFMTSGNKSVKTNDYEGIIFSRQNAQRLLGVALVNEHSEGAYWTPSKNDIGEMERELQAYAQVRLPELSQRLGEFRRQYFGFVRKGEKMILVIGFCGTVNVDWRREMVSLPETASGCYFEGQYDVTLGDFTYLWISSEK